MRSSQEGAWGTRSATRAHPINSQSFEHEFGVPCVPPPTIAFTIVFELPDNVNDRDLLRAVYKSIINAFQSDNQTRKEINVRIEFIMPFQINVLFDEQLNVPGSGHTEY